MTLDNVDVGGGGRLLHRLKRSGPMSARELAAHFAISHEAVRQQLGRLERGGWVTGETQRGAVGRPMRLWALGLRAESLFPDAHAEMTSRLIETIRDELGLAALDRVVEAHERQGMATYRAELDGAADLAERIERLAAIRSREGYMAEWRAEDGGFLFIEHHCPICAAATACQAFCRAERNVFEEVLGPGVTVERTDHILSGARRCAYRITAT